MSSIIMPTLFQDHMMLQADKPLHIWGDTSDIRVLTLRLGEDSLTIPVTDNHFSCLFPAQRPGTEQTLSFYADEEAQPVLVISHISIGDIWIACGQSNMEYALRYDADWQHTRREPKNPDIHMYNCPQLAYEGQVKVLPHSGHWFTAGDPAWPEFSAPGYAFALDLQKDRHIPIGVIGCNWGGTPACAWMDEEHLSDPDLSVFDREYEEAVAPWDPDELREESLKAIAFENSYAHGMAWRAVMYGLTLAEQEEWMDRHQDDPVIPMGPWHHYRPHGLYHTMLEKIAPFTIKGFLWYQGESDSGHAKLYALTLTALIDCFRKTWQDESLPFLFVQLAPFGRWMGCTGDHYVTVRESQEIAAHTVPGTAMACIMDLGMYEDIHPKFKMEVGRRLSLLARGHVYGEKILCDSPEFNYAVREDATNINLFFSHTGNDPCEGLWEDGRGQDSFRCTQGDRELKIFFFHPIANRITIYFEDADPDQPIRIDYAKEDYCQVHIWGSVENLPLKPFTCIVPAVKKN